MKKIAYLGMGAWGYCLASMLASNPEHALVCWTTHPDLASHLAAGGAHPRLPGRPPHKNMRFTTNMAEALEGADMIVESVTSAGLRSVLEQAKALEMGRAFFVITSKGIEQDSGKILPEVALQVLGEEFRSYIGCLSGPSFADDVIRFLPTSVVGSGYSLEAIKEICTTFTTPYFRVYPNTDLLGVAFGGALKNIIGIGCGISEGLALGSSSKAALMTRGLHEIRKLAIACGCKSDTISGLSGMGDLCATCSSSISRNFRFGLLLAEGFSSEEAQLKIGMVVEGAYTCVSALQLSAKKQIPMPITEAVYQIIQGNIQPIDAVRALMQRSVKEEHL